LRREPRPVVGRAADRRPRPEAEAGAILEELHHLRAVVDELFEQLVVGVAA